ncbi:MAG: prepilin peptidase [Rhodopila sp.]|jgi:Flp pilus assembly protein protease CpaA
MIWLGNLLAIAIIVPLTIAACLDVATRTIPNSVSAIVAVVGVSARLLTGPSAATVSIAASLALFVVLLVLHARGMLGGGDVKLIPAIALGLSLPLIGRFIFITAMAGGVLALCHLLARWALRNWRPLRPPPRGAPLLRRVFFAERWRIARHGSLPYGVAIACGGIWVVMSRTGG